MTVSYVRIQFLVVRFLLRIGFFNIDAVSVAKAAEIFII